MTPPLLRCAQEADTERIAEAWHASFGDERAVVRSLLTGVGLLENAVAAEVCGTVRSVMFAFDDLRFGPVRATYLYALCTHPDYRGMGLGSAVYLEAVRRAFARGAAFVCLRPASDTLAQWYASISAARAYSHIQTVRCPARRCGDIRFTAVDPETYLALRHGAAPQLSTQLTAAQQLLCPGSLLRLSCSGRDYPVCAEPDGDTVRIRECLCPPELRTPFAAAAAGFLGASAAELSLPSRLGPINLMGICAPGNYRDFSPFLPLTLD